MSRQAASAIIREVGEFLAQSPQALDQLLVGLRRASTSEQVRLDLLSREALVNDAVRKDALVVMGRYNMLQDIITEFEFAKSKVVAQ